MRLRYFGRLRLVELRLDLGDPASACRMSVTGGPCCGSMRNSGSVLDRRSTGSATGLVQRLRLPQGEPSRRRADDRDRSLQRHPIVFALRLARYGRCSTDRSSPTRAATTSRRRRTPTPTTSPATARGRRRTTTTTSTSTRSSAGRQPRAGDDQPVLLEQHHPRPDVPLRFRRGLGELPGQQLRQWWRIGGDPVQADAQDGSGTNNANFSTPPDGSRRPDADVRLDEPASW